MGGKSRIIFSLLLWWFCGAIARGDYSAAMNVDNESWDVSSSYQPFYEYYNSPVLRQVRSWFSGSNDRRGSGSQRGGNPGNWYSGSGTSANSERGNAGTQVPIGEDAQSYRSSWSPPTKNLGNQRGSNHNGNNFGSNSQKQSYGSSGGSRDESRIGGNDSSSSKKKQEGHWRFGNAGGSKKEETNSWDFQPKTEGYNVLGYTENNKATNVNAWNSEPKTEGYTNLGLSDNEKLSGNQWTGNSYAWNSQPAKNQDRNTDSWNFGQPSSKNPGNDNANSWSTNQNSNSWSPGWQSDKNQGSSNSNAWNQGSNSWNSQWSKKPGNANSNSWSGSPNSNPWKSGSQPGKTQGDENPNSWSSNGGPKKSQTEGYDGIGVSSNRKPSGNQWSGNVNAQSSRKPTNSSGTPNQGFNGDNEKKPLSWNQNRPGTPQQKKPVPKEEVDWSTIEKQNKEGNLILDLTSLWGGNYGKSQNSGTRSKKRDVTGSSEKYLPHCICTDNGDCGEENTVSVMDVFKRRHYHLSAKVVECAIIKKVCCIQSPSNLENVMEHHNDWAEYGKKIALSRSSCGRRLSKITEEDVNTDGIANYGDFPWILKMVALDDDGRRTICSASLIHSSIALTTASCAMLLSGEKIRVVAGEWNLYSGHTRNRIREIKIGKIFLHPEFDLVNYNNDLALVFLDQELESDLGINSICLPSSNDAWDVSRCVIAGWIKEDGQDDSQTSLRIIGLETINQGKCRNSYGNFQRNVSDSVRQDFFCAHSQDGIPCITDAGASLLCPLYNSDKFVQVGLVFKTATCNRFSQTATFTDVLVSMDWISHMEGVYFLARNGLI